MLWTYRTQTIPQTLVELQKILLTNREITDEAIFLSPVDPLHLSLSHVGIDENAVHKAVERITTAINNKESIIIFGDYDCDGVCATTVLWETLYAKGCKVLPFIPHRERHGYGLSKKAIDEILATGKPAILISVDNGIVANEQWQRLKDEGIFCILTDHHQPDATMPVADIIIHSTQLCGTTVAWMLAREFDRDKAASLLDLCAIATIADQVPLLGANRSFASYGLQTLNATTRLGLKLLIEAAGLKPGAIDAGSVNYGIAPRINAMGRLEHALDALKALCTHKESTARALIGKLSQVNQVRQDLTYTLIQKAMLRAKEWENENIIIIEDDEFHEGIIGLIASKLTESFYKPSIVVSRGKQTSKASCRSIAGVNITDLLRMIKDDLLEVGGHPMAAGFKVETSKINRMRDRLCEIAKQEINKELLSPTLHIDCELPSSLISLDTAEALTLFEPYGATNREPLFVLSSMTILESFVMGKEGKHLKMSLLPKDGAPDQVLQVIGFGRGKDIEKFSPQSILSIAGHLQVNNWNGRKSLQFILKDSLLF